LNLRYTVQYISDRALWKVNIEKKDGEKRSDTMEALKGFENGSVMKY